MSKIYIASHSQQDGLKIARKLQELGHTISSTWLYKKFEPTSSYSDSDKVYIAKQDAHEILISDGLVVLSTYDSVPGGKFVEVGIALGSNKDVYLYGYRENMLMWHPNIKQINSLAEVL